MNTEESSAEQCSPVVSVFDSTRCKLGEGPLWHPERGELFWFDILASTMHSSDGKQHQSWAMPEMCSAAGWVDQDTLLVAGQTALYRFDIASRALEHLLPLEADNPITRSNDGRADPWGGFCIGTMGLEAEPGAGSIYRYYKGELKRLFTDITITNSICFDRARGCAYYVDSEKGIVWRQPVDAAGWPQGEAARFLDHSGESYGVDGAVIDAEGNFCCALWGAGRLQRYAPSGELLSSVDLPAQFPTCPAFIGECYERVAVTSAWVDHGDKAQAMPAEGATYLIDGWAQGLPEPVVLL